MKLNMMHGIGAMNKAKYLLVSFVTTDEFSVRVTKITSRIGVSWTDGLPFHF